MESSSFVHVTHAARLLSDTCMRYDKMSFLLTEVQSTLTTIVAHSPIVASVRDLLPFPGIKVN